MTYENFYYTAVCTVHYGKEQNYSIVFIYSKGSILLFWVEVDLEELGSKGFGRVVSKNFPRDASSISSCLTIVSRRSLLSSPKSYILSNFIWTIPSISDFIFYFAHKINLCRPYVLSVPYIYFYSRDIFIEGIVSREKTLLMLRYSLQSTILGVRINVLCYNHIAYTKLLLNYRLNRILGIISEVKEQNICYGHIFNFGFCLKACALRPKHNVSKFFH